MANSFRIFDEYNRKERKLVFVTIHDSVFLTIIFVCWTVFYALIGVNNLLCEATIYANADNIDITIP